MSPLQPSKQRSRAVPEILPHQPPSAEIVVAPHALTVTVALPNLDRDDVDVLLTRNSVRVRSRMAPAAANYVIPLPVAVEPERFVMRYKNGVFDFMIERASR